MKKYIFSNFDFTLLDSPDFKEDSVREELVSPLLNALGYFAKGDFKIRRSKSFQHPFVKTGSGKHELKSVPDYLLEAKGKYVWVLDAKSPNEEIKTGDNKQQAFFYAIHPEINVKIYALCNGKEFIAFNRNNETLIYFHLSEIEKHWEDLTKLLSADAFGKEKTKETVKETKSEKEFDYLSRKPLAEIKKVRKRAARRHFGVHGYFTKQSWDVVQAYIRNFTKPNDLVLDPFGGSGITVVEALMTKRKGIHIDLNPLSIFLVNGLITSTDLQELHDSFEKIKSEYIKNFPENEDQYEEYLSKYPYPKGDILPKGSDVKTVEKLFSKRQKAELAYLKHLIKKIKNVGVRKALELAFSTTLTKINRTYHHSTYASKNAGDCSAFRYYRYRIAPEEVLLNTIETFEGKLKRIIAAKNEIAPLINEQTVQNAQIVKGTATNLDFIENESVDYIYTDPPYGKKIQYLDLSIMWNAWLDLEVTEEDYKLEAIEGGEQKKSKEDYSNLIADSIKEMYRVLKYDRWMSFVFQHQDPAYWHLIVDTAEKVGFEYAGAVKQNNGQTSFKKRQNPFTVLSGQLIINFKKVNNPKSRAKANLGADIADLVHQAIEDIIAHKEGATLEEINEDIVIKFMELNILDVVAKKYNDLSPFLAASFDFDKETEKYHLKKNTKFKAQIPVEVRIKYYMISLLRRLEREGTYPRFDDIVLEIMPLLQNGKTPDNQTVLSVLEKIADRVGEDQWKLRESGQGNLFNEL
jgi:DNA modification methylase